MNAATQEGPNSVHTHTDPRPEARPPSPSPTLPFQVEAIEAAPRRQPAQECPAARQTPGKPSPSAMRTRRWLGRS